MHPSASLEHARHDLTLIAGHAAGDLSNPEASAAADLLSACTSCAELHRDLVAISAATRSLPRSAHSPRDFRLTTEQADRLRRRNWVGALLRPFASVRSATRPLAAAFTSVGVAGLLVATFVPGLLGGAGSAPARESAPGGALAASAAPQVPTAAKAGGQGPGAAAASSPDADSFKDAEASGMYVALGAGSSPVTGDDRTLSNGGTEDVELQNATAGPTNLLLFGSIGLVLVGLAMFGLRFAARRLR